MEAVIAAMLKLGAPWVVAAIFVLLFVQERKRGGELADKLFDLGMAQVKKDGDVHATLQGVQRDLDEIRRLHQ